MKRLVCVGAVIIAALWGVVLSCSAQDNKAPVDLRPPTSGEIPIEDTTPTKRDIRAGGLRDVSTWAHALAQAASQSGGMVASLKPEGVDYLSVLYLFCAQKLGACPFILESILEADIMSSHHSASGQCAIMSHFWQQWIEMDGDKRLQFLISLGRAPYLAQFNATSRQRFVMCKDTVAPILSQKTALASRYGPGTAAANSTATLKALVEEIERKHIDVFAVCGL